MREFVRSDLPELLVIGERMRTLVAGSSVPFALLAGIGAERIFGDVLRAIAFAVLEVLPLENAPRPYDFGQTLGPAIGLLVARRAGGRPGGVAYLAYSGVVLVLGWVGRAWTCAGILDRGELGVPSFCSYGPLELLGGALPLLIGLAIGAIVARSVTDTSRAGANPVLEAAGAYVVPSVLFAFGARAFAYEGFGIAPQQVVLILATTLISGMLAGAICAVRSATPIRTVAGLGALLVATWLYPLGWSQLLMVAGSDWQDRPELLLFAVPLLGAATIPLAAYVVDRIAIGREKKKGASRRPSARPSRTRG